ncbi:DUF2785 domain-containing protein [Ktedonosporobacter rubrisoli]|uniref:DUF2785 domain-containing protein n=1 Tax=Ktedonosporobacter rubrisoli TaxID=2509675 RepID=A0A4P6JLK8_KTERU|nr:DUF2785 domain-containing protein [Ktedonosporobacter rubrisoli]QBD76098.1 DUF2785 domain-containing protein [Ktedonosporobacter rubrisoli]
MDSTFWQLIKEKDFAIPSNYSIEVLTEYLLTALGNPDPAIREGPNHEVLETWIHRGVYSADALQTMANQMVKNLQVGLGEVGSDAVFLRTFSLLILTEILQEDNERPFLTENELRYFMECGLTYLKEEQDARGYVAGNGWAHAVAHAADLLMVLARNRFLMEVDLERLLQAVADKLIGPTTCAYLYEEDERLAYATLSALRRNLLQQPFLIHWIQQIARPSGVPWSITTFYTPEQTFRYSNLKCFLRSLYFQLRLTSPSPQPALLPELEKAIRAMDRGYYELT